MDSIMEELLEEMVDVVVELDNLILEQLVALEQQDKVMMEEIHQQLDKIQVYLALEEVELVEVVAMRLVLVLVLLEEVEYNQTSLALM